jgi:hypothetical protein
MPKAAGDTVTITGTDFGPGATVLFGAIPAQSVTFINANTLSVVAPVHNGGTYGVTVTNPDGQAGTLAGGITFSEPAPAITSVTPNSGYTAGGTNVTIAGTNFVPSPFATFGAKIDAATGNGVRGAVTADFNKDGKMDIATVNQSASTFSVLLGNGDGTYAPKIDYASASGRSALRRVTLTGTADWIL